MQEAVSQAQGEREGPRKRGAKWRQGGIPFKHFKIVSLVVDLMCGGCI